MKNDDLRHQFHNNINRWNAAKNLLLVEKRQDELRDMERVKWQYKKRDSSYWNDGGKQAAAKKVARISTSVPPATPLPPAMTESQLRKKNSSPFLSREQGRDSTPKQENKI